MRHGRTINHLGRTASHRKAMLSNMASSLILHKRITTTVAKAKALRKYVEPLITKAKDKTTHSQRVVFSYLQNNTSVKTLFGEVIDRIGDRPGGYTRILKLGNRIGDNAEMAMIELVDYNEFMLEAKKSAAKKTTRRSRRGSGSKVASPAATAAAVSAPVAEEVVENATAEVAENPIEIEAPEVTSQITEENTEGEAPKE